MTMAWYDLGIKWIYIIQFQQSTYINIVSSPLNALCSFVPHIQIMTMSPWAMEW